MIAAGGAMGGVFVSLIAPWVFSTYREWPIGQMVGVTIAAIVMTRAAMARVRGYFARRRRAGRESPVSLRWR